MFNTCKTRIIYFSVSIFLCWIFETHFIERYRIKPVCMFIIIYAYHFLLTIDLTLKLMKFYLFFIYNSTLCWYVLVLYFYVSVTTPLFPSYYLCWFYFGLIFSYFESGGWSLYSNKIYMVIYLNVPINFLSNKLLYCLSLIPLV